MAHYSVEIIYDKGSRDTQTTPTTATQVVTLAFCLDPEIDAAMPGATFLDFSGDVVALEFAYTIFPISRLLPDRDGDSKVLKLINIALTEIGNNHWEARGTYAYDFKSGLGWEDPVVGGIALPYYQLNFSIGGGKKTIYKSINIVNTAKSTTPPSTMEVPSAVTDLNAIGATEDSLKGIEVPTGETRIQITGFYLPSSIDIAFVLLVRNLIVGPLFRNGTFNTDIFMESDLGEVSLLTASGGDQIIDIIPITFEFSLIPNTPGSTVDAGFDPLPVMRGHDYLEYLWTRGNDPNAKKLISLPQIRIIHQVKEPADYTLLGLNL